MLRQAYSPHLIRTCRISRSAQPPAGFGRTADLCVRVGQRRITRIRFVDGRVTLATDLLNAGVPVHVVQRYLGHPSPEMTMRYAATLARTAEAEFLKAKRAGSFGVELT